MTGMTTSRTTDKRQPAPARAGRPVRILLIVCATLLMMLAAWSALNLAAAHTANRTSELLSRTIADSERDDADWDVVLAQQQQILDQLPSDAPWHALLLPTIQDTLDTNATVSRQIIRNTQRKIDEQTGAQHGSAHNNDSTSNDATSSSGGQGAALSEEQQRKIDEILAANQPQGSSQESASQPTTTSEETTSGDVKPW